MKKLGIFAIAGLAVLSLAGCNFNKCDCNCPTSNSVSTETSNKVKEFCISKGGTYLWASSPHEEHGECMFPSGVGCRDDMILNGECNWEPDISDIDTAQERQIGCENNVDGWMQDMVEGAVYYGIEWSGDEEEISDEDGNLVMITRYFYAKYDKDGKHWKLPGRCEANFVDGSNGTTYDQEFLDE